MIPSVKKEEAIRIYVEAQVGHARLHISVPPPSVTDERGQMTGSSVIIVCTEEHAEHYAQQLKRQQIYAKIEKDE